MVSISTQITMYTDRTMTCLRTHLAKIASKPSSSTTGSSFPLSKTPQPKTKRKMTQRKSSIEAMLIPHPNKMWAHSMVATGTTTPLPHSMVKTNIMISITTTCIEHRSATNPPRKLTKTIAKPGIPCPQAPKLPHTGCLWLRAREASCPRSRKTYRSQAFHLRI